MASREFSSPQCPYRRGGQPGAPRGAVAALLDPQPRSSSDPAPASGRWQPWGQGPNEHASHGLQPPVPHRGASPVAGNGEAVAASYAGWGRGRGERVYQDMADAYAWRTWRCRAGALTVSKWPPPVWPPSSCPCPMRWTITQTRNAPDPGRRRSGRVPAPVRADAGRAGVARPPGSPGAGKPC